MASNIKKVLDRVDFEYKAALEAETILNNHLIQLETDYDAHSASGFVNISHAEYVKLITDIDVTKNKLSLVRATNNGISLIRNIIKEELDGD